MTRQKENSRQSITAKLAVGVTLALLWGLLPACAQNAHRQMAAAAEKQAEAAANEKVAATEEQVEAAFTRTMAVLNKKLAARADKVAVVTMDKNMLKFASQSLASNPRDQQVKRFLQKLNGIYVYSYQFSRPGQYTEKDLQMIRKQFQGQGWVPMVQASEHLKGGGEKYAYIYMKMVNGAAEGMFILATKPKKLAAVYISGPIQLEDLSKLGGNFGIPQVPTKSNAPISAKEHLPTLHVSTRIVDVAIQATRSDGSPVKDLRASDLRVFDNGKPQTIVSFETLEPSPASSVGDANHSQNAWSPKALNYPHYSIILLDLLNTDWSDQNYARRALEHLLDYFPSGERIAIFVLADRLYLLHDFTANAADLRDSLHKLSIGQPVSGEPPASGGPFSAQFSWSGVMTSSALMRSHEMGSSRERLFYQRIRIQQTMRVLKAIAAMVQGIPGQKDLLWVTGGFPLSLHGSHGAMDIETFYDQANETTRALSSAGLRVYPVDARGLLPGSNAYINIDTMRRFAEQTGGRAFYNNNGLTSEVRQALKDASESYLLTYIPSGFRADGSFHKIRVRVLRHGIQLRYRPGYYANPPRGSKDKKLAERQKQKK